MHSAKIRYHFIIILCLSFISYSGISQIVQVSLNRNTILIGEQISYGLKVQIPGEGLKANFSIPDSVPHFDILRKEDVTVAGQSAIEQVITFTSFDSGSWYFPSIPVLITDGVRKRTLYSDSILIHVGYAPADSSGQLRDIKPVMDVKIIDYTIYYIIGGIILALILAYLLYRYFKNRKKKPAEIFKSDLSAYHEAMKSLNELKTTPLNDRSEIKLFHSSLSDIFKRYYSRSRNKNLLSKTTGDILIELKEENIDAGTISMVAEGLRYTDAVKFAKFSPIQSESMNALDLIKNSVEKLENTLTDKK